MNNELWTMNDEFLLFDAMRNILCSMRFQVSDAYH